MDMCAVIRPPPCEGPPKRSLPPVRAARLGTVRDAPLAGCSRSLERCGGEEDAPLGEDDAAWDTGSDCGVAAAELEESSSRWGGTRAGYYVITM